LEIISNREDLRERLADWRTAGEHIALVPTAGHLHEGHVSLVDTAKQHAERVVVSIFANPEPDAESVEQTGVQPALERDQLRLRRAKADLIFAPDLATMYPFGIESATTINVPMPNEGVGGRYPQGHFSGMTTVIGRLLALVQPDVVVLGQKDYEQQLVVRRMVEDIGLPIRIVSAPICRETDGLAMSSRNQDLNEAQREIAPGLHATLVQVADDLSSGQRDYAALEAGARSQLEDLGLEPEYVSIRRAETLEIPDRDCDELVVLGAARLGDVRLVDNEIVHV